MVGLGGFVVADSKAVPGRLMGTLGVSRFFLLFSLEFFHCFDLYFSHSRAIGDFFVQPYVSCDPYISSYQISKEGLSKKLI